MKRKVKVNREGDKIVQKKQSLFLLLYGLIFLLLLSGCWDSKELKELAIVLGVGVDQEGDLLHLTAEIAQPDQMTGAGGGGSSGSGSGGESVFVTHSSGATLFDAVRNARSQSSRRLFFPNNEVVVLGHDLAQKGFYPAFDFFLRDHEPRATSWVLVAEEKARDIFEPKSKLENTNGTNLSHMIELGLESKIPGINVQEVNTALLNDTQGFLIPLVTVSGEEEEKRVIMGGNAGVFIKDKMVGEMNSRETRGVKWVKGEVKNASIAVKLTDETGFIDSEIFINESSIKIKLDDGDPKVRVKISVEGNISDQSGTVDLSTPEGMQKANAGTGLAVKEEVLAAIKKAKLLQADVFGFGGVFERTYPQEWQKIKSSWQEKISILDVSVEVQANLWRIGEVSRTVIK